MSYPENCALLVTSFVLLSSYVAVTVMPSWLKASPTKKEVGYSPERVIEARGEVEAFSVPLITIDCTPQPFELEAPGQEIVIVPSVGEIESAELATMLVPLGLYEASSVSPWLTEILPCVASGPPYLRAEIVIVMFS